MLTLLFLFVSLTNQSGTFSIVGMDPETREWGIAVASRVDEFTSEIVERVIDKTGWSAF